MAATLRFEHDIVGNIMYIEKCPPYPGQDEDDIEDGVIARRHHDTDEVASMMVLFYSSRIVSREPLRFGHPSGERSHQRPAGGRGIRLPGAARLKMADLPGGRRNRRAAHSQLD